MKTATRLLSAFVLGLALPRFAARAEIIAYDSFIYPSNAGLAGLEGGGGAWLAPWVVSSNFASVVVKNGTVEFGDGAANPLVEPATLSRAFREFSPQRAERLFVKYSFSLGPGTSANPDRFFLELTGLGNGNGWGTLEVGTGLNHGHASTVAAAVGDGRISVRVHSTSANRVTDPVPVVDSAEFTVIVEISKPEGNPGTAYNTLRLWINPGQDDYKIAVPKSLSFPQTLHTVSRLWLNLDETEPGDVLRLSEVMLATTWEDVTADARPSSSVAPRDDRSFASR